MLSTLRHWLHAQIVDCECAAMPLRASAFRIALALVGGR